MRIKNTGTLDRVVRGVAGAVLILSGLVLVKGVLGVVLAAVGAVLLFSASIGFCHVYKFFHIDTSKRP
jgi:uncharacterized membrane protein